MNEKTQDVSAETEKAKVKTEDNKVDAAALDRAKDAKVSNDPNAPTAAQREEDRRLTEERGDTMHRNPGTRAPDAVARQHDQVDAEMDKRNEQNRPGHEKNMERIEAEAHEAHARTEHADNHLANHVPTGKQRNRNTPVIDKDGNKRWVD